MTTSTKPSELLKDASLPTIKMWLENANVQMLAAQQATQAQHEQLVAQLQAAATAEVKK
jgi:hypothetical protein